VECIVMLLWKIRDSPGKGRGTRSERAIGRGRSRFLTVSRLIVSAERLNERLENWHRSQPSDWIRIKSPRKIVLVYRLSGK